MGERTFVCRPPRGPDFAALRKEMRRQIQGGMVDPIETVNRRISEAEKAGRPLSPTVAQLLVANAFAADSARAKAEPTEAQLFEQASTVDGVRWFAWWLVRKAEPDITIEEVSALIPDDETAFAVSDQIGSLTAPAGLHPNS